ncbi:Stk1 family PASTA domain-containing Ser/Thr kinase [Nocardioides terrisoli]|uniref:Stk1 family PASTA domain-containing Ser/Thr kinase n=1 Tax=Nocardioides terrisoli TaxID=3388267 RepID=UPI00287BA260|nr:Stk1 family PASTA domain-containing Ser/Thr kinase [Nocardioides marmorisolisilvae]
MTEPHRIGGRYELGELLGRGGMAEVRKGTDVRLGRTVAIKRLRTDLASDATFQARFRREAQSAASLNHPAIVSVYDTGEELSHDGTDVAQPYIVMEYVAGRTLRDILREGRKILPERALEIASGVLSALDYSHRMGIIHRDIKPGNVMLTPSGDVKVMDFGIARAVADSQSTMTQTAAVVGTAQYLSPEQARGENVDSRSDVYSAGCLLYELLTGRPPFVGESPVSVAYQHVREQAPVPSSLDPELPAAVDAIVMKALAKRVDERYSSAAAMKADIDRYLAGQTVQAPPVAAAAPATAVMAVTPGGPSQTSEQPAVTDEPRKRSTGPLVLLALLLLALIAAAVFLAPKLIHGAPNQVSVPDLSGMTRAAAQQKLSTDGLGLGQVKHAASQDVRKGQVMGQDPTAGQLVDNGSAVDITISTGKPAVTIPDVIGDNKDAAASELRGLGLRVHLKQVKSDEVAGNVVKVDPNVGEKVAAGTKVTVSFASGQQTVPDVVGLDKDQAKQLIRERGFKVSVLPDNNSTEPKGTVTRQSPGKDTPADQGTTVTILVSTYEPPTNTPSPTPTPTNSPSPTSTPTDSTGPTPGL